MHPRRGRPRAPSFRSAKNSTSCQPQLHFEFCFTIRTTHTHTHTHTHSSAGIINKYVRQYKPKIVQVLSDLQQRTAMADDALRLV